MIKRKDNRGFTIVELLIVIAVIAILAAITIVSYSTVSGKANTTSALSAAEQIQRKGEVYYNEPTGGNGQYPATLATLTGATADKSWQVVGPVFQATAIGTTQPTAPNYVNYYRCGHNGTITAPVAPATNITVTTGFRVAYFDYNTKNTVFVDQGNISTAVGTFPVVCLITAS